MKTIILSFFLLGLISAYAADLSDLQFGEIEWDDCLGPRYAVTNCNPEATGSISAPAEYNGTPITTIGDRAFASCHQLTEIHLEEGIHPIPHPTRLANHPRRTSTYLRNKYLFTSHQ